jgi:hypothetical protein
MVTTIPIDIPSAIKIDMTGLLDIKIKMRSIIKLKLEYT